MRIDVEIRKKLVLINSASSMVVKLLNLTVLVWLYQYLLTHISVEEYEIYPVVMAVMVFIPLLTLILTSGVSRYIVAAYAQGSEKRVTEIVSSMFPLLLGASALQLLVGWTLAWNIGRVLTITPNRIWDARLMLGMLVLLASLRVALVPFGVGMFVRQKMVLSNVIQVTAQLLRIAILFALLLGVSTRIVWVVFATFSSELVALTATFIISRRLVPALRFRPSAFNWQTARSIMSFGGWLFVVSIADMIHRSADPIVLNKLGIPLNVANFHIGGMPSQQIQEAQTMVSMTLEPALTAMHAKGQPERLANAYLRGGKWAAWLAMWLALPIIVFHREIVILYIGEKYLEAGTVMTLLLGSMAFSYCNIMLPRIAKCTANVRPWALRALATHVTNLLLSVYLVGYLHMGAKGSALGSFVVVGLSEVLLMWPEGRRVSGASHERWLREVILPMLLPCLPSVVVLVLLQAYVRPSSWIMLGACTAVGMLVYGAVMVVCFSPRDRQDMGKAYGEIRRRLGAIRANGAKQAS